MGYIKNAVAYVAPGGAAYPATVAAVHMPATGIAAGSVLLAHPSTIPSAAAVIGYALIPGIGPLPFTAAAHSATPMDCDAHTSLNGRVKSKGAVDPDSPKNMDHDIHGAFNISSDGGASSNGGGARPIDSSGDERMASRKRGRTAAGSSGVDARAPTNKRPRAGTYVPAVERARAAAPRAASSDAPPAPPKPLTPKQKQIVTQALIFISGIVSTPEGPMSSAEAMLVNRAAEQG
ncbi:hypothetical protein FOA52_014088 [Chlamydomonas sp. UWO 241]|nr:hypothetical protein FOA52_014088 [Chlamydomonas sp. UWO 241]